MGEEKIITETKILSMILLQCKKSFNFVLILSRRSHYFFQQLSIGNFFFKLFDKSSKSFLPLRIIIFLLLALSFINSFVFKNVIGQLKLVTSKTFFFI